MRQITDIKELQAGILDIFKEFDIFCSSNNLDYYLMGGTLLGAIRHEGFIPWDDDIDVCMPRKDYEKFLEITRDKPIDGNYKVISWKYTENYFYPFAKMINTNTKLIEKGVDPKYLIGLYIDIFPVDSVSNKQDIRDKRFRKTFKNKNRLSRSIRSKTLYKNNVIKYGLLFPYRLVGYKAFVKNIEDIAWNKEELKSNYVSVAVWGYGEKGVMLKKDFEKKVEVNFEGIKTYAPSCYHEHLNTLYGDYMSLPPIEDRVSNHNFDCYIKED